MLLKNIYTHSILDPEFDVQAISYQDFKKLFLHLPYGSVVRVMLLMLAFTGCRVSELGTMLASDVCDNCVFWRPGKNQKGRRKETLPCCFVQELLFYRASHKVDARLFGLTGNTFRRKFNMLRREVGGVWMEKTDKPVKNSAFPNMQFRLQLKGFRKTFQTVLFKYYLEKYGDAAVALEFVSKRMRHSCTHMTAYHYIENYEVIDVVSWVEQFFCQKPRLEHQSRLEEFAPW